MTRGKTWLTTCIATLAALPASAALADSPFQMLLPFQRIESDPKKSYELRDEHGPWLIVAATFLGDAGERQAHQLVVELRREYRLHAYTYHKQFDHGDVVRGRGVDQYGNPKRMRHVHAAKFKETAVLIGDFDSFDSPDAQKALKTLKYAHPKTLSATPDNPTAQRMISWRFIQKSINSNPEVAKKGPMGSAFITKNPKLPASYFAPKDPNKMLREVNSQLEHSLLSNRGKYTVRVATFRGASTWEIDKMKRLNAGDPEVSKLAEAADKAHRLVDALRKRGVEAYEFHDRHESIVTIGSFESYGTRRRDGKIEMNPEVHKIMKAYGAQMQNLPGLPGAMRPKSLIGIPFDAQPMPVEVPKL